ncbi:polysaccharide biosynthesis/export family protein [Jannaschia sp. LMIT008]|uniref:polysaccharide biosynthesis/export family protein n=1 Tax=Jannaschia maritima TaxID=3032585 RepID=UPI0028113850|nr:polysaccharide biosynthesis/export family protein [Jannaschia sp. LMIT008]
MTFLTHAPRRLFRALLTLVALLMIPTAAPAQGEYRVSRGDVLRIEVLEDETLNRSVLVAPSGQVTLPLAGQVSAAGRSLSAVQAEVRDLLAPNFSNPPTVFVSLESVRPREDPIEREPVTIGVFVLGEVASPGRLALEPGTTLLQAISAFGGFADFAATKRIQLRRRGPDGTERIYPINYQAIQEGRSPNGTVTLIDGDVILVPTRRLFE